MFIYLGCRLILKFCDNKTAVIYKQVLDDSVLESSQQHEMIQVFHLALKASRKFIASPELMCSERKNWNLSSGFSYERDTIESKKLLF